MDVNTVRLEFEGFLNQYLTDVTLSGIDDVLVEYIVNVLEQLGDDESFDLDGFVEMIAAYIPGFETISSEHVWEWMLNLVTKLNETKSAETQENVIQELPGAESNPAPKDSHSISDKSENRNSVKCSENPDSGKEDKASLEALSVDPSFAKKVDQLVELFPSACALVVKRCLLVANGDVEEAVSLMLLKDSGLHSDNQDSEQTELVDFQPKEHHPSAKRQDLGTQDVQHLKDFVVNRYLYVDVEDDKKTHRPVANVKKGESKKMVRYIDNQVVSTKGERYTLIKKQEDEDMKKTYVNLKPARKYRFH